MRIWIDLANSPHVPFFHALEQELTKRGHTIEFTARDFAETVYLAQASGLNAKVIGKHGGRKLRGKGGNLTRRAWALARWARGRGFDLALSHNSYSQILAGRLLRLRTTTLMDYEHQPANHLAFRLASRIIVPVAIPFASLRRFGATPGKLRRYSGTKEDVYLADFHSEPNFEKQLYKLGVQSSELLVVLRPPATEALYHRFENELFNSLVQYLLDHSVAKMILLPRNESQRALYVGIAGSRVIIPPSPLDGPNLIAASDLVISAGGTMNREAAALGTPAASIYRGTWAAVDEQLVGEGRLTRLSSKEDFAILPLRKKLPPVAREALDVRRQVIELILDA
ncbi:MAG TPA: DUF354 domain-containing protein [Pyrinomonadaceae bacterium]|nr:DUF354 domain-containing protein [Pyrinomonadaceae bacterium]